MRFKWLGIGRGEIIQSPDGIPGRDYGHNWLSGLLFYLKCVRRHPYVRVEYFFEYIFYLTEDEYYQRIVENETNVLEFKVMVNNEV